MSKVCEYQGYYIDYDEETGEEDVLKCNLFTDEGEWNEYCYCDEEERNNCMLYKYSKYIEEKDKEIEKLRKLLRHHQYAEEIKFKEILTRNETIEKKDKENERLHSIIKEVREYIEKYVEDEYDYNGLRYINDEKRHVLEILDKEK